MPAKLCKTLELPLDEWHNLGPYSKQEWRARVAILTHWITDLEVEIPVNEVHKLVRTEGRLDELLLNYIKKH